MSRPLAPFLRTTVSAKEADMTFGKSWWPRGAEPAQGAATEAGEPSSEESAAPALPGIRLALAGSPLSELLPELKRLDRLLEQAVAAAQETYGSRAAADPFRGLH